VDIYSSKKPPMYDLAVMQLQQLRKHWTGSPEKERNLKEFILRAAAQAATQQLVEKLIAWDKEPIVDATERELALRRLSRDETMELQKLWPGGTGPVSSVAIAQQQARLEELAREVAKSAQATSDPAAKKRISAISAELKAASTRLANTTAETGKIDLPKQWSEQLLSLREARDRYHSGEWSYKALDWAIKATGSVSWFSYAFVLFVAAWFIKVITKPLNKIQFEAMRRQAKLAPIIKEIQEKYKGDLKTINQKTMEAYKENNVNMTAVCLPMLIQMPILLGMYYVIRIHEYQFSKGSFLWVPDLSRGDIPLVLVYAASMLISGWFMTVDPSQRRQQMNMQLIMAFMLTYFFVTQDFPSAFVLYWLFLNLFSTIQQLGLNRAYHAKEAMQVQEANSAPAPIVQPKKPKLKPGRMG